MSILVMKFGGTSVANLNRIKNLYKLVKQKIDSGQKKLVIVVSAMSGVTNRLVKEFKKIDDEINNPEYDVVVSTGEQYSSAIISAYLNKKGIRSRSLMGWQIPIFTDDHYSNSKIQSIDHKTLKKYLKKFDVLVIAGFQGISSENRITTLGRGGSDTSAVAISAALNSPTCEIYTDVKGIYSADPRLIKNAKNKKYHLRRNS